MPSEICFRAIHRWALLPYKHRIETSDAARKAKLYEREFRWLRARRVPPLCRPWRLGQELGWLVPSPIDVRLTPIQGVEVEADHDSLQELAHASDYTQLWHRDSFALVLKPSDWLRFYQYRTKEGWMCMFLPNGEGSVEWHLGWQIDIPDDMFLLIMPGPDIPGLEVPLGVLDAKSIGRFNASHGVSIAVRPQREIAIRRGDPVARLVLLHAESVGATSKFLPAPDEQTEPR
ncbi:hypothetical protein WME95_06860 [Sorangium sp. So ce327]|jgi:hypothetical protein|uniref:hypothetical protein n=1 Tax=Sorangium sp. So ce327 TaxID=3133301 RepID=UPI003F5EB314